MAFIKVISEKEAEKLVKIIDKFESTLVSLNLRSEEDYLEAHPVMVYTPYLKRVLNVDVV